MATSRVGTAKVLHKLKKSVEDGNYYEAHQMYHSVFQRYVTVDSLIQEHRYNKILTQLTIISSDT